MKISKWFAGAAGVVLSAGLAIHSYLDHARNDHTGVRLTDEARAALAAHEQGPRTVVPVQKPMTVDTYVAPEDTRDDMYRKATLAKWVADFDAARTQTRKMDILAGIFETLHKYLDQAYMIGLEPDQLKQLLRDQGKQAFQELHSISPATELDRYVLLNDKIRAFAMSGAMGGKRYDSAEAENATGTNWEELQAQLKNSQEQAAAQAGREINTFASTNEAFGRLSLDDVKRQTLALLALYDVGNEPYKRQDLYLQSVGVSPKAFSNITLYWNKLDKQKYALMTQGVEATVAEMSARQAKIAAEEARTSPFAIDASSVPRP